MHHHNHIAPAIMNPGLSTDSTLHVVAMVSNPLMFHSRYRLFRAFVDQMQATKNVELHVVEIAHGDREFEVTRRDRVDHLQLRTSHWYWFKENAINLGVKHLLPRDWKYVAWIDGDVTFNNSNWVLDTLHELQNHSVVQPWGECVDMGPQGQALQMFRSFGQLIAKNQTPQSLPTQPYGFGHPGYAWAATRSFWEETGGLIDFAALGSADSHMAWGMIGKVDQSYHAEMSDGFKKACLDWQVKALHSTGGYIGYVPGLLTHHFHGPKARRYYRERWQILVDHHFDPSTDVRRDHQGLMYVNGKPALERDIMQYMKSRDEDSIEV